MAAKVLYDERELLIRIADDDETAFRNLFHQYWDNIYQVSLMLTKSPDLAEDMVQEIFLKIWLKRKSLPNVENFSGYLFITARNHILDELRKRVKDISFSETLIEYFQQSPGTPEQHLLHKESTALLQKAVESLPDQQKKIYQLIREKGLSREEIAELLGISKNTVRNNMARALQSLRQYLQQHSDGLLFFVCLIEAFLPGGK